MKKIYSLAVTSAIALSLAGCTGSSSSLTPAAATKIDQKDVCSVEKHGIAAVLANAKLYNETAIKEKVEYRKQGVNNSDLIIAVEEGLKAGAKEIEPKNFSGKPSKQKYELGYAATRACTFGLNALQLKHTSKSNWRASIPGDGYKY